MTKFRTEDQVLFQSSATVVREADGIVRVRFGDVEFDAVPSMLTMVRRSVHVGDEVRHEGVEAVVTQKLDDDVFLVNVRGATGVEAYRIANASALSHADDASEQGAVAAATRPAPAAKAEPVDEILPESVAPAADDEPLELTHPIGETRQGGMMGAFERTMGGSQAPANPRPADQGSEPPRALTGDMINRGAKRPLDLEGLGTTETLPALDVRKN